MMDTATSPAEAGTAFPPSSRAGKWRGPFKKVSSARHDPSYPSPSYPSPSVHPASLSGLTMDEPCLRVRPLISGFLNLLLYSSCPIPGPHPRHAASEPAGFSQLPGGLLGRSSSAKPSSQSHLILTTPRRLWGVVVPSQATAQRGSEVGWVVPGFGVWLPRRLPSALSLVFPSRSLCLRGSLAWLLPAGSSAPAPGVR